MSVGKVRALDSLVLSHLSFPSSYVRVQKGELHRPVCLSSFKKTILFQTLTCRYFVTSLPVFIGKVSFRTVYVVTVIKADAGSP